MSRRFGNATTASHPQSESLALLERNIRRPRFSPPGSPLERGARRAGCVPPERERICVAPVRTVFASSTRPRQTYYLAWSICPPLVAKRDACLRSVGHRSRSGARREGFMSVAVLPPNTCLYLRSPVFTPLSPSLSRSLRPRTPPATQVFTPCHDCTFGAERRDVAAHAKDHVRTLASVRVYGMFRAEPFLPLPWPIR